MQLEHSLSVASSLKLALTPKTPVYRVGRGFDPLEPPPWDRAEDDGTFGNRFDDPSGRWGVPAAGRFRVVYAATDRVAAFAETIARFRPSPTVIAALQEIEDDEPLEGSLADFVVPADWRSKRRIGGALLKPDLRFVDVDNAENMQHFRVALAKTIVELGLPDCDLSAMTGPSRQLTQAVAHYVYNLTDAYDNGIFAGLRYTSRLNPNWTCWALFIDRIEGQYMPSMSQSIMPDDEGLVAAARLFGFDVETLHGSRMMIRRA